MTEIVSILKSVGGIVIPVSENYTDDDYRKRITELGIPEFFQEDILENGKYIHEFGCFGGSKLDNDVRFATCLPRFFDAFWAI